MDGRLLNIPESVSLALHSLKTLVNVGETMSAGEISRRTGMSANHLSKVLRRLVVGGIICASKGPNGGFFLTEQQKEHKLMDVYLLFGKPPLDNGCIYENALCDKKKCVFGGLVCEVTKSFFEHFTKTRIGDL